MVNYNTRNTNVTFKIRHKGSAVLKLITVLVIMALLAWGVHWIANATWQNALDENPYPKDPADTTANFFQSLQQQDYDHCYSLLTSQRKIATGIGRQSRNTYDNHFDRIRNYLIRMVGNNFADDMEISTNGQVVDFANDVRLTLTLVPTKGLDNSRHYAIDQINEFPEDVAPGIGIEQHNRQVNQAIESGGSNTDVKNYDDIATITAKRRGETPNDRLQRFINTFHYARQLDTRHEIMQWLVKEFPRNPATINLLTKILKDKTQPPQLRKQARQSLNYTHPNYTHPE